jgi:hypothetical protein
MNTEVKVMDAGVAAIINPAHGFAAVLLRS